MPRTRRMARRAKSPPPPINFKDAQGNEYYYNYLVQPNRPINFEEGSTTPPPIPGHAPFGRMDSVGNIPTKTKDKEIFDIVEAYQRILRDDPEITMPVAAIESLVELLSVTDAETVYETLDLIRTQSALLKSKIPNSISLTAGLDLFRQFIMNMLKPTSDFSGNFELIRTHLVTNGTTFVERAKHARQNIATWGQNFIRDGHTVMTHGGSRVVAALLLKANLPDRPGGNVRFNVIYVMNQARLAESQAVVDSLRVVGIPVAEIDESAVAYAMDKVDLVIVGAEGVVENGGIISRLGTYQLALIAKSHDKKFLVAAETHKFVRLFPLTQDDIGDQRIVEFREAGDTTARATLTDAVDYTRPDLISAIITENGPRTTSAVTEELIYIHYS